MRWWWQLRKSESDLEREVRSDLELEEEEQQEKGLPPEEAGRAARRAFGNEALIKEQTREEWGWVLGRLVGPQDGGADAAGVIVLTYRFWSTVYKKDPHVIGKSVRLSSLGDRSATVIGVLEPSVPYPAETEIIGNLVISPHHLSATMVTGRIHRMTELFGKLAPGATLEQARNELRTVYASMEKNHPDAYPDNDGYRIDARMLRDQITSGARTVLLVLLAASGLVFIIACRTLLT